MSYEAAVGQLEVLVNEIESGQLGMDDLTKKVKQSVELIAFCRAQLHETNAELQQVLKDLNAE